MRNWTFKSLTRNIQKRFGDRLLYIVKLTDGQIVVRRKFDTARKKEFVDVLKLSGDASKDFILKRLYEMDTWGKYMNKNDLSYDVTPDLIVEREVRKYNRLMHQQEQQAWSDKKKSGNLSVSMSK